MESGRIAAIAAALVVTVVHAAAGQGRDDPPPTQAKPGGEKLVYADFEKLENGRAVSARGGMINLFGYQESDVHKTTVKGSPTGEGPELVHVKPDDPNHLGKFSFSLMSPNNWAGATMEIHGLPDVDGKPQPDDVTGFKKITMQLYVTGAETVRIEVLSKGQGNDVAAGWPQMHFKVRPGLNTYEVALKALIVPGWVDVKMDPKKVLQKLTALNIIAFCEPCRPTEGMLIVDNVVFEK